MASEGFPAHFRLKKRADFTRVYDRRCSASDGLLLIYADCNGLEYSRLGLSVSRKVGPAVKRNRWKRLLREAFRLSRTELPMGIDMILIPRSATEPELRPLAASLVRLAARVSEKLSRS